MSLRISSQFFKPLHLGAPLIVLVVLPKKLGSLYRVCNFLAGLTCHILNLLGVSQQKAGRLSFALGTVIVNNLDTVSWL